MVVEGYGGDDERGNRGFCSGGGRGLRWREGWEGVMRFYFFFFFSLFIRVTCYSRFLGLKVCTSNGLQRLNY